MKNIIHNIQSVCIKFICLSLILAFNDNIYAAENKGTDSTITVLCEVVLNSSVYNSENKKIILSKNENYFVVLKNNRSCEDCFREINYYVNHIKDSLKAKFIVISIADSTTLERKRNYHYAKSVMPDFDDYFFQYNNQNDSTLFDILKTQHTPEIIIIRSGKIIYIPNNKVFDYPSLNVSVRTQIEIAEYLK